MQLCKILHNNKKLEAQHTGIIESFVYPLIKSKKVWEGQTPKSSDEYKYCKFFFNIAVVNSDLYTINSEEENALPVKAKYVPFIREVRTKDIQGHFLITFVTLEYLKEFIENEIEGFCKKVYERYTERPELLLDPSLTDLS